MKFGLFDHVDQNDRPLVQQFDERLEFVAAADEGGFYCLLVAEHHGTPLNMVPNPAVYLAAAARITKNIRLGALVFLLPLYSPLRLIEEIAMLDHLSHGRLEVGVGRGVSISTRSITTSRARFSSTPMIASSRDSPATSSTTLGRFSPTPRCRWR